MRRPIRTFCAAALVGAASVTTVVLGATSGAAAPAPPGASAHAPTPRIALAARPHRPSKVIMPLHRASGLPRGTRTAPISYHGGKVLTGTVHVHLIWYGAWSGKPAVPLLTDLVHGFAGTSYAGTNATYTDAKKHPVSTDVVLGTSITDAYTRGKQLSDPDVRAIVINAIHTGQLPADSSAIYAVMTSADVKETSGFATRYCGWHTRTTFRRTSLHYLFAGDPSTQAPTTCAPRVSSTPNGDRGADALASTLIHEIDETLTDPDIDAWYDRWGSENADKCAWTYGSLTYSAHNGAPANVSIGGHDWLIQQNWIAGAHQGCALAA